MLVDRIWELAVMIGFLAILFFAYVVGIYFTMKIFSSKLGNNEYQKLSDKIDELACKVDKLAK